MRMIKQRYNTYMLKKLIRSVKKKKKEYWGGLPFPTPGDLPDSGTEPTSPYQAGSYTTLPPGKTILNNVLQFIYLGNKDKGYT